MKELNMKNIKLILAFFAMFSCLGIITLLALENIQEKNELNIVVKEMDEMPLDRHSFEVGKSIGRNAMFEYINTYADFNDTLYIELLDLLALEDTLSKKCIFKEKWSE